jgi:D-glycero-D-manno-heptose 1,7-bisphosphate phosphatase
MLVELASRWGVELTSSYIVGDSWRDMEAGRAAGCGTVLVRWPHNDGVESDRAVGSLAEAADHILGEGMRDG